MKAPIAQTFSIVEQNQPVAGCTISQNIHEINFHFAKNGKHWVKAKTKFKMALLLPLD